MNTDKTKPSIDLHVFIPSFFIALLVAAFLIFSPTEVEALTVHIMSLLTSNFGWLLEVFGLAVFFFAMWLAFGRYGQVKLSRDDSPPEYSELNWAAMMFSAGIGIGLLSYSFVEPIYYLSTPPMSIAPHTSAAAEWGHMYTLFHWSFVPWALYGIPAVAVAYMLYVDERPYLRMSELCNPLKGKKGEGIAGSLIDTLIILGLISGAGTSLGLGVPLVSELITELMGIEESIYTRLGVIAVWTVIFGVSVYKGLKAGIQILSDINMVLAILFVLFVLLAGPTVFILSLTTNSLGLLLNNFLHMSLWLDPIDKGGFPDAWTLFYWGWWIAYAPLMGLFFGRISKGRTIKHLVLGTLLWGSLGCIFFLSICGAYSLNLELTGLLNVSEILNAQGIPATVVAIINTLPLSEFVMVVVAILCFIFLATTLDSSAYILASISTKNLTGEQEPARGTRLAWAFVLGSLAVGLLFVSGLATIKSITIILALPLIFLIVLMIKALLDALHRDFAHSVRKPQLILAKNITKVNDQQEIQK